SSPHWPLRLPDPTCHLVVQQSRAVAEIRVARYLARRCGPGVDLLFNRRLSARGRDGDIDVLAVAQNGVHIIDVKRYKGAAVRVRRTGGLVRPVDEQLLIRGRNHSKLLGSVGRQERVVRSLLDQLPDGGLVRVDASMCFVDADLPWTTERVAGVALLSPKGVARRLNKPGPLDAETRGQLLRHLAGHLPPA
ncbi:nuclease-related domain-containing protein, partial [Modestobacter marinus]